MSCAQEKRELSQLMSLLREWDVGSTEVRRKILQQFIDQNKHKTGPQLDAMFANAASLFFTRLTAWLRITHLAGTCLLEQLKAIKVFLKASSSHKFLLEFLEVGCVGTLVTILGIKQLPDTDKAEALKLLSIIASTGRRYKELICESYGIRAICECMGHVQCEKTRGIARSLLQCLGEGNDLFHAQVYKGLVALLACESPSVLQMAAMTIRKLQPTVKSVSFDVVQPVLNLLRSVDVAVHVEVLDLISLLTQYDVREEMIHGLFCLLAPAKHDLVWQPDKMLIDACSELTIEGQLAVLVQQAGAIKCIRGLAIKDKMVLNKLMELSVIHQLLYTMGNMDYVDSQRQAAFTIEYLCENQPAIRSVVQESMGEELYDLFMANAEEFVQSLTQLQADILTSNKVNVKRATVTDLDINGANECALKT